MKLSSDRPAIAFYQNRRIASGGIQFVATEVKQSLVDEADKAIILDSTTGETIEIDFRGSLESINEQFTSPSLIDNNSKIEELEKTEKTPKRGRPKLGVVAREITLLPRHWDWLKEQQGGASVALRKLVEQARKENESKDNLKKAQEYLYRFLTTITSHYPEYEEALRALFAGDSKKFEQQISAWPKDIILQIKKMAVPAFHSNLVSNNK
ncbi:MAG: DUF2239 family protein [Cellvibrionaceae bacterium]